MPLPTSVTGVPASGDVLSGKYQVERVLGVGGMGVVLAARHVTLGQRVAIKFLLPQMMSDHPEAAERFLREARASINLRSEHVARVIDVATGSDGAPYMVMEYLDGRDLHQILQERKRLDVAVAIEYVLQAAEALAEAHGMGIVHRDLKPANLFLTTTADGSGLVKVLDFGISKSMAPGERGITSTKAVMGSPGYMSPEQIKSAKHVDQRTDVWSVGVILYEFLSGVPPFDGDNIATLSAQIVLETPKPLPLLRAEIPEALNAIVQRCLEKDANRRYRNMAELAQALKPFASREAAPIVERIVRIAGASAAHGPTVNANDALASTAVATQAGGWARTKAGTSQQRAVLVGAVVVVVLGGVLTAVFFAGKQSAGADAATAAQPASAALGPVSTPVVAPSPDQASATNSAAVASPAALPSAVPSSEPVPSASKPSKGPSRAVSRGIQCPKGQSLSSGHCCPSGLVWQGGRCDRPLATTLP